MENTSLIIGQQLINGLVLGAVYGLIAIGYSLVYGILGLINFAHGDLYMIATYLVAIFLALIMMFGISSLIVGLWIALAFTVFIVGLYAVVIERMAYRPLRHAGRLTPLISAIGVSIILENLVRLTQGSRTQAIPLIVEGQWAGVSYVEILILITACVSMGGLHFFVQKTTLGCAMRATQQDWMMAEIVGVNTNKIISLAFFIGGIMAAIAGGLVTLNYGTFDFSIGFIVGMKAFASAVVGGIGSLRGAMLGGMLLGLAESLFSGWFSSDYKDIFALSLLIVVLIFKPTGILGKNNVEKL